MKNIIFLFFTIIVATAMLSCKKNTKPLSGVDYYIENTFSDSVKMNVFYKNFNGFSGMSRDTTVTYARFKGKERRFIISTNNIKYGYPYVKHEMLPNDFENNRLYGVRANGDTIRPARLQGVTGSNSDGAPSLAAPIYWQKEINEDTGAAVYTLILR